MTEPWPIVALEKVVTPRKEFIQIDDLTDYKRCRVQLHAQGIVLRDTILGAEIKTKKQQVCHAGEFLVAEIDAKVGGFGIVPDSLEGSIVSSHYFLFGLDESSLDRRFLDYFIRTKSFQDQISAQGSTNYAAIRPEDVLDYEIPLPLPDEQRRIVARIEELAARIEEARELRRRVVEETEALIKSYYKTLFDKISLDGRLSDVLLEKPKNGWSAKCDNAENGVPVLTLSAVTGFGYRENEFKRTSEETLPDAQYWLNKGDLLITRSNTPELVGHAAIYNGSPTPCIYPDLIMRLKVNEKQADTNFVHSWLKSSPVRQYIAKVAIGTSPTMKKISQKTVMDIPFPIQISIQEQRRIVVYLDGLQTKLDALKRHQAETAAELDALLPAMLERAFRGELSP